MHAKWLKKSIIQIEFDYFEEWLLFERKCNTDVLPQNVAQTLLQKPALRLFYIFLALINHS